jgi:GNAT superfamily N-acetyltransferase
MPNIQVAETEPQIRACYPVMAQLRPHLSEEQFVAQVRRQQERHGYQLVGLHDGERVVAVAGFRVTEFLAWGKVLYVDDLVTDANARSRGHGDQLFTWLVARAREQGCDQLHLDSGVQRFEAHRFYLRRRMNITSHHFAIDLREAERK